MLDKMSSEELRDECEAIVIVRDRYGIVQRHDKILSGAKRILENPELVQLVPEEKPYIWEQLHKIVVTPTDMLMQEEEADSVLLGSLFWYVTKSEWRSFSLDEKYNALREELNYIYKEPELVDLVPGERLHIWKRLEELHNMSREELMNELELGTMLGASGKIINE